MFDAAQPNQGRYVFLDPRASRFHPDWDTVAGDMAAMLHLESGRSPADRNLSALTPPSPPSSTPRSRPASRP
jgi:hypothetical protein